MKELTISKKLSTLFTWDKKFQLNRLTKHLAFRVLIWSSLSTLQGSGKVCVHTSIPIPHLCDYTWCVVVVVLKGHEKYSKTDGTLLSRNNYKLHSHINFTKFVTGNTKVISQQNTSIIHTSRPLLLGHVPPEICPAKISLTTTNAWVHWNRDISNRKSTASKEHKHNA